MQITIRSSFDTDREHMFLGISLTLALSESKLAKLSAFVAIRSSLINCLAMHPDTLQCLIHDTFGEQG